MKRLKFKYEEEYVYDSEWEREVHVKQMVEEGWEPIKSDFGPPQCLFFKNSKNS